MIMIYLFRKLKLIQYMVVNEHPSINRHRVIDMRQPLHRKQQFNYKDMPSFKSCVYAHQLRPQGEIDAIARWIKVRLEKTVFQELIKEEDRLREQRNLEEAEEALKEYEKEENEYIFVANGRVIYAKQHSYDENKRVQGMYELFSSYNMNIVAAQNIDMFLYCLCKNHTKYIDGVPLDQCQGGVYVYALEQMISKRTNFSVELLQAHVGANRYFYFDKFRKRFMYMKDYDNLMQMPIVHTNIIAFAGMPDLKGRGFKANTVKKKDVYEILIYRVIDQNFYAFTTEEEVYKWEINTGKLIQVVKLADLRTLYYCLTRDPVQHFEEYSI